MHALILLGLLPAALGCLNPTSNKCASYIKNNAAASTFCATFTQSTVTATTALPAWATNCDNKPKLVSAECSCHYTAGGGGSVPTPTTIVTSTRAASTTTRAATTSNGGVIPAPSGVTRTLPKSSGAVYSPTAIPVSGSFDGGMKLYDRSRE
jgi:pectate lyase